MSIAKENKENQLKKMKDLYNLDLPLPHQLSVSYLLLVSKYKNKNLFKIQRNIVNIV